MTRATRRKIWGIIRRQETKKTHISWWYYHLIWSGWSSLFFYLCVYFVYFWSIYTFCFIFLINCSQICRFSWKQKCQSNIALKMNNCKRYSERKQNYQTKVDKHYYKILMLTFDTTYAKYMFLICNSFSLILKGDQ